MGKAKKEKGKAVQKQKAPDSHPCDNVFLEPRMGNAGAREIEVGLKC